MKSRGYGFEAWELDWATRHWCVGEQRWTLDGSGAEQAAFEAVAASVSPVGVVKLAGGQRVVLRMRAALLAVRNPRRTLVQVGTWFRVAPRDSASVPQKADSAWFLVVEKIDDQGTVCKLIADGTNPLELSTADKWMAVGLRVRHDKTMFRLMTTDGDHAKPLVNCSVWISESPEQQGAILGCPSPAGEISVISNGMVRWLHFRVGGVTVTRLAVFPGNQPRETVHTGISSALLVHASSLAVCRDDVAEVVLLNDIYLARADHRVDAGRPDQAAALGEERQKIIRKTALALLDRVRTRRNEIATSLPGESERFASQWAQLISTLDELTKPAKKDSGKLPTSE